MGEILQRNSSMELVRIIAQWMIVVYHLLYFYIFPATENVLFKALQLPLHIGVILYVLISGYYGIKPSFSKLFKLLSYVAVYTIPLLIIYDHYLRRSLFQTTYDLLFVSRTPYWFVRTYLYLYMISPLLNMWLKERNRSIYLISVLCFISMYIGTLGNDSSLYEGKNILNFCLIYAVGHELRIVIEERKFLKSGYLFLVLLTLNAALVIFYCLYSNTALGKIIWLISFPYNSPLLILNSIIVFILMAKLNIQSKSINYVAASSFAIYLIHTHPYIRFVVLPPICKNVVNSYMNNYMALMVIFLLSVVIMVAAVIIDKGLTPLWKMMSKTGNLLESKFIAKRFFLCIFLLTCSITLTHVNAKNSDRETWVNSCYNIARPVFYYAARDSLKLTLPTTEVRSDCYLLEAVGRTLCGTSSWLNLNESEILSKDELEKHRDLFENARNTLMTIVTKGKRDFVDFSEGRHHLVDAAYLCLGLHRCPRIWDRLPLETRSNIVKELKKLRAFNVGESNWLLFVSMIEAFLYEKTGSCDESRLDKGLYHFIYAYYLGDGVYGDGYAYHNDYYNSYVIHPMLTTVLLIRRSVSSKYQKMWNLESERLRRWAANQERSISPEGTMPVIGRSITCRTGILHGLSTAVLYDILPEYISKGQIRSAMTSFMERVLNSNSNLYDSKGFLKIGFVGSQPRQAETYCCQASMYHCLTAFLPLGLSENSLFWSEPSEEWSSMKVYGGCDIMADSFYEDRSLCSKLYQSLYRFWICIPFKWALLLIIITLIWSVFSIIGIVTTIRNITNSYCQHTN